MKKLLSIILIIIGALSIIFYFSNQEKQIQISTEEKETYIRPDDNFSFSYPKDFSLRRHIEAEYEAIILEDRNGNAIQIFTAIDEGTPLTEESISESDPEMIISNFEKIRIGKGGIEGVSFTALSGQKETREVWFVHKGFLYALTARPQTKEILSSLIKTISFN